MRGKFVIALDWPLRCLPVAQETRPRLRRGRVSISACVSAGTDQLEMVYQSVSLWEVGMVALYEPRLAPVQLAPAQPM
ncbi:hypothetical protein GCM10010278_37390 [Streptomyces melanogenes]|nr:hypothetical protein GCM10010278_37390 [Streptomyces melanogenes]